MPNAYIDKVKVIVSYALMKRIMWDNGIMFITIERLTFDTIPISVNEISLQHLTEYIRISNKHFGFITRHIKTELVV